MEGLHYWVKRVTYYLQACYACGGCETVGGLLITSVAQIYFIFPQLPFPACDWEGGTL